MFLIDLETGKSREAFTDLNEQYCLNPGEIRVVGNLLYGQFDLWRPDGARELWMVELDPETEDWRLLFPTEASFTWAVYGDTLYYLIRDVGFREYHLTTGETVDKGLPIEDAWFATYDEDYIYLRGHNAVFDAWASAAEGETPSGGPGKGDHMLYILTRDYELVDQIFLQDGESLRYVTDDALYFCAEYYGADARLEKSSIGSGQLELQPLE